MLHRRWTSSPLLAEALLLGGYLLLTVCFLYPLSLQPGAYIPIIDSKQLIWSCWWMRRALELGVNPFVTPYIYYPEGVSLYFHTFNPIYALLSVPLQYLFGLIVAYNLMAMLVFVGSGYAACWLGRDITGSRLAGFAGGVVFAFAPTQVYHFSVGQAQMHTVLWMPLYVLCVRRWLGAGGLRWLLGAIIALALSSYADWQLALYLQLFTGLAALWLLTERGRAWRAALPQMGLRLLLLAVLYLVAVGPVLLPMLQQVGDDAPYMLRSRKDTVDHSADLLDFLLPNPSHPLWGAAARQQLDAMKRPGIQATVVSLSYAALLLAGFALAVRWRQTRFWAACGLFFVLLAMGPQLRLAGAVTPLPLPYELLMQLRVVQITRVPARYFIMALLCLSVLAAIGLQVLRTRRPRYGAVSADWLAAGMIGLLCFELLPLPITMEPVPPAPAFFTDGTLDGAGALIETPAGNLSMYYQTLHGHPTLYGQTARDTPPGRIGLFLHDGLTTDEDMLIEPRQNWLCALDYYRFTHLVLYRQSIKDEAERRASAEHVAAWLGQQDIVSDTPIATLYRLPSVDRQQTCLVIGEGWGSVRPFAAGEPFYRWAGQQSTLGMLRRTPARVRLHAAAHSFAMPRQLEIRQQGVVVARVPVGIEPAPITTTLDLPAGLTWIELRSVEPAVSPADYGYSEERPVSIGFSQVWVEELADGQAHGRSP